MVDFGQMLCKYSAKGGERMRVNVNLSEELVKKIDERAKAMYISRSSYIAMALATKMQAEDMMSVLPELTKLAKEQQLRELQG